MTPVDADLDALKTDAANVADFLAAMEQAIPGTVPDTLLAYLGGLGDGPVGLSVLLAALKASRQAQQPAGPRVAGMAARR